MTGYEASSLFYTTCGLLVWPWVLRDYPRMAASADALGNRRRVQLLLAGVSLALAASAAETAITAPSDRQYVLFVGLTVALGHVIFVGIFLMRFWERKT